MVSIIVPIYNNEKYLHTCVNSILSQTYKDIEIILVDDGSSDKSGAICDNYAHEHKNVRSFHQENGGASLARYNGVKEANGEWAFFVDADDEIMPNAIEILISLSEGYDIISGSLIVYDVKMGQTSYLPPHIKEVGTFSKTEYLKNLILGNRLPGVYRQLIKMDVLKKSNILFPRDINIGEDFLANIKIGLNINKIKGIKDVVYKYNIHDNNITKKTKLTISYEDNLDSIITGILLGQNEYDEVLFRRRMDIIERYILQKNLKHSSIVQKARKESCNFHLNIKDKLLLHICIIDNLYIRKCIWKTISAIRNSKIFSNLKTLK